MKILRSKVIEISGNRAEKDLRAMSHSQSLILNLKAE